MLQTLRYLSASDYFFLRLSMASGKAVADAASGIEASSVVTAMSLTCRGVSIRVSGLGDAWFDGPFPDVSAKLFDGFTADDIEWIGGESLINETVGLGGFAQAAAFPLQNYQGGSPEAMIEMNLAMYRHHGGGKHRLQDPVPAFPRHSDRHRRTQGGPDRHHPGP